MGVYEALGSGILGDEKVVKENIRIIFNWYLSFTQSKLWCISQQLNRNVDLHRIAGWYNLFNTVRPGRDSRKEVGEIKRNLEKTRNLEELSRLVECEKFLFKSTPPAISLQEFYLKCLEERYA